MNTLLPDKSTLGISSAKLRLDGVAACGEATLKLARQAKRSIYIFSYDLDHQIYNQRDFIAAVKDLAIHSRHSQIKIILQNNERVQREGHRLVQLWRRLTSKIEIRKPDPDHITHLENFLLADTTGYLHRKLHSDYSATVDFNSKFDTQQLSAFFDEVWELSEPESELRDLHI